MAITYNLGFVPKWYIADIVGKPLGGGYLATFSNLDHTQLNPVYQDASGSFVWPYVTIPNVGSLGILFDENGSQGPFYFAFDSASANQLYYLEVYDSDGVLQWTIDDYSPVTGSGGSIITTALDLENLIINNVMWRNLGVTPVSTTSLLKVAPSAHSALANNVGNVAGVYTGPDAYFIKNNTSATDTIAFPRFLTPNVLTGDVTPVDYLEYKCNGAGSAETIKCIQYPITQGVQNLANQEMTVTVWAKGTGTQTLLLSWYQFFGDGAGATASVSHPIQTLTLTNSWQKFVISDVIPDTTGSTLGECGNDGLFFQVGFPLNATCVIDFTKPCVYLGDISPDQDYHTYDMIDGIINAQRTGYVMQGFDASAPPGYIAMNDASIGSSTSGATNRANTDTFPLYNLLWNNVSDTWAPVATGRGASAVADFEANKALTLTRSLGRVLGGAGAGSGLTARALGEYLGEETHTLTIAEMPSHTHPPLSGSGFDMRTAAGGDSNFSAGTQNLNAATTGSRGLDGAHNNMQPSSFMNFYIKL